MAAVESGLPKVQQEQSEALRIGIENNGAGIVHKDELRLSPAKCRVSIKEMLTQPCLDDVECLWEKVSICRIQQYLKDGKDKDYEPQIFSLGPYHHGKEHLRPMDQHKLRCLRHILKRTNQEIDLYLDSVKEVEERARACYEETISMSSNEFVEMMVLDGCFAIELLQGFDQGFKKLGYHGNDPIFSMERLMPMIQDMILLENQIPLFILNQLLELQLGNPNQKGLVAKLALRLFDGLKPTIIGSNYLTIVDRLELDPSPIQGELHCLALFWLSLLPSCREPMLVSRESEKRIPCVTELWKAGIEFSMRPMDSFMDIRFEKGTLKIPQLEIHERTRSLFLNLIAFEQSRPSCSKYVAWYVTYMGSLIRSPEDVGYLCQCKIIENWLGSKAEVAALFNQLSLSVVVLNANDHYLAGLWREVDVFCDRSWNRWEANLMFKFNARRARLKHRCIDWASILKQNYFSNPWSFISLVAACVLLGLTCIQTFYTAYGYYRPRF